MLYDLFFFFFQAEDGIRDRDVTGVQTCALPISLNREDMKDLLNGLMLEQYATVPPSTPYYGKPLLYKYDPDKAKALLKESGCLPCKVTFAISTSGSGQMQPLPMNELVKSQLE